MKNILAGKRLWNYVVLYKGYLFVSIFLASTSVVFSLCVPVLIGEAVDTIIDKGQVDFSGLGTSIYKIAIAVGGSSLFQWLMSLCNNKVAYDTVRDIRIDAFERLARLPLKEIDSKPHGEYISLIINDADQVLDGLLMSFSQFFTGVITIIGTLVFMFRINVMITILVIVITPLSFFVASFVARRTYKMFHLQSKARGEMTGLVEELVGNQKIVKTFGYEKESEQRFMEINETLGKYSLKAIFFSSVTNPTTRFINGLVYTGVGVLGGVMAMHGQITVGQLSGFLTYANQYTKPFNEISGVVTELQNAFASANRVFSLIDITQEEMDSDDCIHLTNHNITGSVQLENISFSYQEGKSWMKNLNLSVHPGQRIAIVGPTGCGKTTLINLLMRFFECTEGDIKIESKDHDSYESKKLHSIKNISRSSLRKSYGMVLQDTWLKSATVAENISYGKPEATLEEVVEAAKTAHAHYFIERMPQGYDTMLSETGGNLSVGQKQLLCIARVMLTLPPMLLLDEATSSIDTRTEIRIQRAFEKMLEGRTSFIVAHRLSTIQEADLILIMKDGNIIEQGTHEQLLIQNGFYAKFFKNSL